MFNQERRILAAITIGVPHDRFADKSGRVRGGRTRCPGYLGNAIGQSECLAVDRHSEVLDPRRNLCRKQIAAVSEIEPVDTRDHDRRDCRAHNRHSGDDELLHVPYDPV